MENWKGKWLTKVDRTFTIKAILSGIPNLPLPKGVKRNLNRMLWQFFYQGTEKKKKQTLVKWESICIPKEYGGLGIKNWSS